MGLYLEEPRTNLEHWAWPKLRGSTSAAFSLAPSLRAFIYSLGHGRMKGATDELFVHQLGTDWNLDGTV